MPKRCNYAAITYCTILPFLEHYACTDFTCEERLSYLDIYSISISNCLITLNASVNFLIYAFNSSKFRQLVVMKYRKACCVCVTIKWDAQGRPSGQCHQCHGTGSFSAPPRKSGAALGPISAPDSHIPWNSLPRSALAIFSPDGRLCKFVIPSDLKIEILQNRSDRKSENKNPDVCMYFNACRGINKYMYGFVYHFSFLKIIICNLRYLQLLR